MPSRAAVQSPREAEGSPASSLSATAAGSTGWIGATAGLSVGISAAALSSGSMPPEGATCRRLRFRRERLRVLAGFGRMMRAYIYTGMGGGWARWWRSVQGAGGRRNLDVVVLTEVSEQLDVEGEHFPAIDTQQQHEWAIPLSVPQSAPHYLPTEALERVAADSVLFYFVERLHKYPDPSHFADSKLLTLCTVQKREIRTWGTWHAMVLCKGGASLSSNYTIQRKLT